jgi:alanyl-tRNA synthetase
MVDKLGKTLQHTKDLEKKLDVMMEKMAQLSPATAPIQTHYKGKKEKRQGKGDINLFTLGIPLKIHLVDRDLDASYMQKRANVLRESEHQAIHLLVKDNLVTVALNSKTIPSETANSVSMRGSRGVRRCTNG